MECEVAENAHLEGTTRCFSQRSVGCYTRDDGKKIVKNTSAAFGAEVSVSFDRLTPLL